MFCCGRQPEQPVEDSDRDEDAFNRNIAEVEYNLRKGNVVKCYEKFLNISIFSIKWSPEGNRIAVKTGHEIVILPGCVNIVHQQSIGSFSWNNDGTSIASSSFDGTAKISSSSNGHVMYQIRRPYAITEIALSSDDVHAAIISDKGVVELVNVQSNNVIKTIEYRGAFSSVAWSHDGTKLAVSHSFDSSYLIDASTGETICTISARYGTHTEWGPDGTAIVKLSSGAHSEERLTFTNIVVSGLQIQSIKHHSRSSPLLWSPDRTKIAISSGIVDATTGHQLVSLPRYMSCQSWNKNSKQVVAVRRDAMHNTSLRTDELRDTATIHVIDSGNGKSIREYTYTEGILQAVWAPDGTKFAAVIKHSIVMFDFSKSPKINL